MLLSWKRITEIQIDRTHGELPAASLRIFHPFDFPSTIVDKRPYLGLSAVLVLPNTASFIISTLTNQDALLLASFIVNQENLNPHRTIFVFDLRSIFENHFRQIFFEWNNNIATGRTRNIWSARRIIKKNVFRKKDLDNFIEADPELFNKYYEQILKLQKKSRKY